MHGDKDNLVPIAQSQMLADALGKAGVPCDFQIVPGAGHGKGFTLTTGLVVRSFFINHLKVATTRPIPIGDASR